MKIRLSEIHDSKDFYFDKKDGKLDEALGDLTKQDYKVDLQISDKTSFFTINGDVKTEVGAVCSKCGDDTLVPVHSRFNDMMVEKMNNPRGSQYSKANSSLADSSDRTEVAYYENDIFDLGEYLHEQVALAIPEYPECNGGSCSQWEQTQALISSINEVSEVVGQETGHPGFAALKDLKLN